MVRIQARRLLGIGLLLVAGLLSACDRAADADATETEYERWATRDGLLFGHLDHPDYAFGPIEAMAVGPDGVIYTAHPQEVEVLAWTAHGEPIGRIGRDGQGPGEFLGLGQIGFQEGMLWVMDPRGFRLTYFSPTGGLDHTESLIVDRRAQADDPTMGNPRPRYPLGDGTFYGVQAGLTPQRADRDSTLIFHLHVDAASAVLDTILVQTYRRQDALAVRSPSGQWLYSAQPFADGTLTAGNAGQGALVAVDRTAYAGDGVPVFHVTRISMNGDTVFHQRLAYDPEPIDAARVEWVISRIAQQWQAQPGGHALSLEALEELAEDALYAPAYYPPVSAVVLGRDGTIWLGGARPDEGGLQWSVLDPQGQPLAKVHLPLGLRVMVADREHVWGIRSDRLGVTYVHRYAFGPVEATDEP